MQLNIYEFNDKNLENLIQKQKNKKRSLKELRIIGSTTFQDMNVF